MPRFRIARHPSQGGRFVVRHALDGSGLSGGQPPVRPAAAVPEVGPIAYGLGSSPGGTDANGGMEAEPGMEAALAKADFVSLPRDVEGTNCGNCQFIRKAEGRSTCGHPRLEGQSVNDRNCCGLWNNPGALRTWK